MKRIIFCASAIILAKITLAISGCSTKTETFTLWQLPSQVNTIGNSYVIQSVDGNLKTVEVRGWIKEKGITEHYVSNEGLCCIR